MSVNFYLYTPKLRDINDFVKSMVIRNDCKKGVAERHRLFIDSEVFLCFILHYCYSIKNLTCTVIAY